MSPPGAIPANISESTDSLNARISDPSKPCRACTDFKTWAKMQASSIKTPKVPLINEDKASKVSNDKNISTSGASSSPVRRFDCPVDKDELGAATWTFLHTMAAYYPDKPSIDEKKQMKQFISIFANFYPCDSCASNFRKEIISDPPNVDSQQSLAQWFCTMHNNVNVRINKPLFDCKLVNQRWRDGWLDGSCD